MKSNIGVWSDEWKFVFLNPKQCETLEFESVVPFFFWDIHSSMFHFHVVYENGQCREDNFCSHVTLCFLCYVVLENYLN
jgi:hypothetical protein